MKKIILLVAVLLSSNVFAKRCVEYFEIGEDAYLNAVSLNKEGNALMKEANANRRQGNLGAACGGYEIAVTHYQATLELISEAVLEMWGAQRNCFRRSDRNRATENLDLLKRSSTSVKGNMDKAIDIYHNFCE